MQIYEAKHHGPAPRLVSGSLMQAGWLSRSAEKDGNFAGATGCPCSRVCALLSTFHFPPKTIHMTPKWRQIILECGSTMPRHVTEAPPPPCDWKLIT